MIQPCFSPLPFVDEAHHDIEKKTYFGSFDASYARLFSRGSSTNCILVGGTIKCLNGDFAPLGHLSTDEQSFQFQRT